MGLPGWEGADMKNIWVGIAAAVLALSCAMQADAAEAKKIKPRIITGTIETLDAAAGSFSVKGKVETVPLKAGEKVSLEGLKVGDKVTATYAEGVASKVVAARKASTRKEPVEGKDAAPSGPPAGPSGKGRP